jgi:hypothetical protein
LERGTIFKADAQKVYKFWFEEVAPDGFGGLSGARSEGFTPAMKLQYFRIIQKV